jgi:hypothetical protein
MLATACTSSAPETTAPATPVKTTDNPVVHWQLTGRVTPGTSVWPDAPPFQGGKAMIAKCRERRPCAAERWTAEDGTTMDLTLIERTMYFEDGREPWPARWMSISGTLRGCVGDPLTIPPTDDIKSVRTLTTAGDEASWTLHFSGENSCGLEGQLRLDAYKDSIDLQPTLCEGKRWREGGRDCAKKHLKSRPR